MTFSGADPGNFNVTKPPACLPTWADAVAFQAVDFEVVKAGRRYWPKDELATLEAHLAPFVCSDRVDVGPSFRACDEPTAVRRPSSPYQPLPDEHSIRLLELQAGAFDEDLRVTLHVCSLQLRTPMLDSLRRPGHGSRMERPSFVLSLADGSPVWYTALSYCWGDLWRAEWIPLVCNGRTVDITESLDTALRHLRHPCDNVMLWVDQISINQDDQEEKAHQVSRMGEIYQTAKNLAVWLGESQDNSSRAIETLRTINAIFTPPPYGTILPENFESLGLPAPGSPEWSDLDAFFSRPCEVKCAFSFEIRASPCRPRNVANGGLKGIVEPGLSKR